MPQSTLHTADYLIIVGYFLLLTLIGLYFWRRMKDIRNFFTAGNDVPWWLAGVSYFMTSFSAFMFVAYAELAYRYGFVAIVLAWAAVTAMAAGTIFLAARWRRARIVSPVEFLEARYNKQVRQVLAWAGIPLRIVDDGMKIYATGVFVSAGLGLDLKTSIIASGAVMLVYTFLGGLWAVVVTDYLQFIVLILAVSVLFPLVFANFESFGSFSAQLPAGFWSPANAPIAPIYVLSYFALLMVSYNGNWSLAQKFLCVPDERAARKAGWLATVLILLGPPIFLLPAMAGRLLMPELLTPPNSPQYVYALLAAKFLPAGLMGLMVAAMFSATMSTLSSDYNVVASVITEDIYRRLFHKDASEQRLMLVGRIATLAVGGATVAIGVALVGSTRRSLFEIMVTMFGIFVGPMLIPLLLGLLSERVTWRGAAAGIAAGFASGLLMYFYKTQILMKQTSIDPNWLRYNFEGITIFVNFAVTLAAIGIATLLTKPTEAERARIKEFFAQLAQPISSDVDTHAQRFSPFGVIAAVTIGTGALVLLASLTINSGDGRNITISIGIILCLLGAGLTRLHQRLA